MIRLTIRLFGMATLGSMCLVALALSIGQLFRLADNEILYTASLSVDSNDIYRTDIAHRLSYNLTKDAALNARPVWSPDGQQIAFAMEDQQVLPTIYIMDADGSHVRRLIDTPHYDWYPAWSPDGKSIAYISTRYDASNRLTELMLTYVKMGETRRLTDNNFNELSPNWSPDGQHIAFVAPSQTASDSTIYDLNILTGEVRPLVNQTDANVKYSWSPDGHYLLYTGGNVQSRIFLRDNTTNQVILLVTLDNVIKDTPDWSPDGRFIMYTEWENFYADTNSKSIFKLDVAACLNQPERCRPHLLDPLDAYYAYPRWRPQ